MFILVALLVLSAFASFTAATFTHFTGGSVIWGQAIALGDVALFVAVIFASFRREHLLLRITGRVTAVGIGLLNFALFAALGSWLGLGISRVAGWALAPAGIAGGLYGAAALTTLYGLVNGAYLRVTRYTVRLSNLPAAWEGREVALVSDIHVGNIRGAGFVRRIVSRLQQLKPAAVLIAGDMFDGAKVNVAASVAPWATLRVPYGTYFVTGNHDEFSDRTVYLEALAKVGVRVLGNEKVDVEGLQIVGIHDAETHRPAVFRELLDRAGIDRARASILVAHQPAHLEIPEQAGISLQVSGHTHLGQMWPMRFFVQRIYGKFAYGLNRLNSMQVVTSSGAGSWGPPSRVGTVSEIVLLKLENASG